MNEDALHAEVPKRSQAARPCPKVMVRGENPPSSSVLNQDAPDQAAPELL